MTYSLDYFKKAGIYREKVSEEVIVDLEGGKSVIELLPEKVRKLLSEKGGSSHEGDYSRQDSSAITSIIKAGFSPKDAYVTFASSIRGKDAAERKSGHFEDYLQRTIRKAAGFVARAGSSNGNGNGHISVNFGKKRPAYTGGDGIVTQKASEVETEKTRWTWPGYIPAGKITILAGDPGMGKSTIALDLVSRISSGTFLPTGGRTVTGTCLIASAEDAPEDTITPRLIISGGNLKRVEIVREVRIEGQTYYLSFPRDLSRLRDIIVKKGARILIIDPLNAFLEKGTDTYKDQDIRLVLAPLESIAEETGASILIIAHLNKKEDSSILYRIGGSIGFIGAARSVLAVSNTAKEGIRVLYCLKSNLAKKPPALEYETQQKFRERKLPGEWMGESKITSSAIRWRGEVDFDPTKAATTSQAKIETEAEDFLRQILSDAEVSTEDIFKEAGQAGISRSQLNRVKTAIGVKSIKKKDGKWWWRWPSAS